MLLHRLKVKNLASLRGEHTVDFEVLSQQDLFAITGETGAGKSTLLNALSLVLYGKVYKRQLNQSDLVTLGEREAHIELDFSARGERYRATLEMVVRKKDGTPLAAPRYPRFLYRLMPDGEARVMEGTAESTLQLDFEQFCKCVVLNQGEFARFLTAGFAERRDILERLYPGDNIDAVGGLAKRKWEERQARLRALEAQAHVLQEEALFDADSARQEEARTKTRLESAQSALETLRPRGKVLATLIEQVNAHARARDQRALAQGTLEGKTEASNQALSAWRDHNVRLEEARERWGKRRPEVEGHVQLSQEARIKEEELRALDARLEDFRLRLVKGESARAALVQRRGQVQEALQGLASKAKHVPPSTDWAGVDLAAGVAWENEAAVLEQKLEASQRLLTQLETDGKESRAKLEEAEAQERRARGELPEEWRGLERAGLERQLTQARSALAKEAARQETLSRVQAQMAEDRAQLTALAPRLEELGQALLEGSFLQSMGKLRTHLLAHHPQGLGHCPLCEQTVGEELWGRLTASWSEASAQTLNARLAKQEQELQALRGEEASRKHRLKSAEDEVARLTAEGGMTDVAALARAETVYPELVRVSSLLEQLRPAVETSRKRWRLEHDKLAQLQAERDKLLASFSDWADKTRLKLGTSLVLKGTILRELQQDEQLARDYQALSREAFGLEAQLTQAQEELTELNAQRARALDAREPLARWVAERKGELSRLYPDSTPAAFLKEQDEILAALGQTDQRLHNEYRLREKDLGELRARLSATEEQIRQVELLFTQEKEKLGTVAVEIGEAMEVLTPMAQKHEEEERALQEELSVAAGRLSELKTRLEKDRQTRERRQLLLEERTKLSAESARYQRLMDVLGQDDLRTYALSMVEAALVRQTNHELEKLCGGRYEIQHNSRKGKPAPEFWIIDRWRDGLLRKVTTLSGGETFMVSLAMALALAEMARGRADVDCFFIDEGFGTLDEDSLDGVLEMLQQVRSRGKQIGLITHVRALSSRLPLNLHVQKDVRGNSSLGVVWN